MATIESIKKVLTDDITTADLISVWNEYCDRNKYMDGRIEDMNFLDDDLNGLNATQIIQLVAGEDFYLQDDWYKHTIYGIESISDPEDVIDLDYLAAYIVDNDDHLYCSELRDALDDDEEGE